MRLNLWWILPIAAALVLSCAGNDGTSRLQITPVPEGDVKFREIFALPKGIEVTHVPNPVEAVPGGRSQRAFTWLYKTSVRSSMGPVAIVEFGAFSWDGQRWALSNHTGEPFTKENFTQWYSCPDAIVRVNQSCSDEKNWGGADVLERHRALWYFVGIQEDGTRVKGTSEILQLDRHRNPMQPSWIRGLRG